MKDNFSLQSTQYAKFRPTYPGDLYDFLWSLVEHSDAAWDCGTGNGQVANELAKHFKKVYATDISVEQITNAVKKDNIVYAVESAEKSSFADGLFDLVTVAQAIHWFNFDAFYAEVKRTTKHGGILAVIGYGLATADKETDAVIDNLYNGIVGTYWDTERSYIEENYETIPFPFEEIKAPALSNVFEWTFEQMIGYLETWSAVQHYIRANKQNPVNLIYDELKNSWKSNLKTISFPILLRIGKL